MTFGREGNPPSDQKPYEATVLTVPSSALENAAAVARQQIEATLRAEEAARAAARTPRNSAPRPTGK